MWRHLYVRHWTEPSPSISEQVRKSWNAPEENRKHQKNSSSTEELQHSLCQAENNHKYCVTTPRPVQPELKWVLSLAGTTAEYEISGTSMQEQATPYLKVSASYTPQGSQSRLPSPSAAQSSTRGTKQPKAPAWGTCKLSKMQSYCITPTLSTQRIQFWSNKDAFHFSKPSKPWKTTYPKEKTLQQQESNNRWFERALLFQ